MIVRSCELVFTYSEVRQWFQGWFAHAAPILEGSVLKGLRRPRIAFEEGCVVLTAELPLPFGRSVEVKIRLGLSVRGGGKTLAVTFEGFSIGVLGLGLLVPFILRRACGRFGKGLGFSTRGNAILIDVLDRRFGSVEIRGRIVSCTVLPRAIQLTVGPNGE